MTETSWRREQLLTTAVDAEWIVSETRRFNRGVRMLLPSHLDAYARIFHPAGKFVDSSRIEIRPVGWHEVAEHADRIVHGAMEWGSIIGPWHVGGSYDVWDVDPAIGRLPERETDVLATVVTSFTSTPGSCWFAFWEGRNFHDLPDAATRIESSIGPMVVFHGPVTAATKTFEDHGPNLWWPQDQSWCVATDVDLMSSYVAGSHHCIDTIVRNTQLEALVIPPDQDVTWKADTVNPLPPGAYQSRRTLD